MPVATLPALPKALLAFGFVIFLHPGASAAENLRLGTEGAYPPFNSVDSDGQLHGFDIDIGDEICRRLDISCTWVTSDWEGIIPGLEARRYDAIVASMSITAPRAEKVDFSKPYYAVNKRFLVCGDTSLAGVEPDDMADLRIGTQAASTNAGYLEDLYPESELRLYPTMEEAYDDLKSGRLDAVLSNIDAQQDWMQREGQGCRNIGPLVVSETYFGVGKGIAVRKGETELIKRINTALDAMFADGTYDAINARYFQFSIRPD